MSWVQVAAGWGLGYLVGALILGVIAEIDEGEFWSGIKRGIIGVTVILLGVTLALLANGWLPS